MADVQRLNASRRIRRPKKKANVMNDKHIRDSIAQYSAGGYSAVQFLSSVCHCSESVTSVLIRDDEGSSAEEYDLTDDEDNGHSNSEVTVAPAAASVPNFPPHVTFVSLQHAKTLLSCHVDMQRSANNVSRHLWQLMVTVLSAEVL